MNFGGCALFPATLKTQSLNNVTDFIVLLRVKHVDMKWPNQQEAKADKYIDCYNLCLNSSFMNAGGFCAAFPSLLNARDNLWRHSWKGRVL